MPVTRKNTSRKRAKKKAASIVLVTKTFHPAVETHFPEKIKKAKEILTQAGFRPF
jgi:hypothetical protein